jgi:hypothetical protein
MFLATKYIFLHKTISLKVILFSHFLSVEMQSLDVFQLNLGQCDPPLEHSNGQHFQVILKLT